MLGSDGGCWILKPFLEIITRPRDVAPPIMIDSAHVAGEEDQCLVVLLLAEPSHFLRELLPDFEFVAKQANLP